MDDTYDLAEPTTDESPDPAPQGNVLADKDVFCIQCGYNLHGLTPDRHCPECGTPIERSLRGNRLRFSSPDYLRKLHLGVFLILAAIIAQIVLGIGAAVGGMLLVGLAGGTPPTGSSFMIFQTIGTGLGLLISAASLIGWWLFSTPDPAFIGQEQGTQARQIIRASVAALVAIAIVSTCLTPFTTPGGMSAVDLAAIGISFVSLAVNAVKFFAAMLYMRWLTPRIPDQKLFERSKKYMWLLPLLATVGAIACGIGPLIALVLYWNHFEYTRRHIKQIRRAVEAEFDQDRFEFERSHG